MFMSGVIREGKYYGSWSVGKSPVKMEFSVQHKGRGQGIGWEDETVEELWELREIIIVIERCSIHLEEVSDDEEEYIEETEPQGGVDPIRLFNSILESNSRPWS